MLFIELKTFKFCKEANFKFRQMVYNLRRSFGKIFGRNRRWLLFLPQYLGHCPDRQSNCSSYQKFQQKSLAFKIFQFCNLRNQQTFIVEEEVSVWLKELAAFLNTLRQFLKQYDKTVKFPALYHLRKPKQEIGFTLFKDELFAHYFQDIKEHCNRQIRLSFRFERNKDCCFPIKKFNLLVSKTF